MKLSTFASRFMLLEEDRERERERETDRQTDRQRARDVQRRQHSRKNISTRITRLLIATEAHLSWPFVHFKLEGQTQRQSEREQRAEREREREGYKEKTAQ